MNGSTTSGRPRPTLGLSGVQELLERLRTPSPAARRPERSDVRVAVLTALAERPGTGSEVVRALQDGGGRHPGPGVVHPMLRVLADEGLATAAESDGRRTWTLTAAGRTAAAAVADRPAAEDAVAGPSPEGRSAIAWSGARLAQITAHASRVGSREQVAQVVAVLDAARRDVLAILARG